jgi:hypothetical protein
MYLPAKSRMLRLPASGAVYLPARSIRGRGGLGQLATVATAIQTQEGYYPGSVAYVNNNPGNLMAAGQPGCTATAAGFCSFDSYADGWNALLNQISLDASRGETISQFISKYAPASAGNDPTTYANNVASAVGLSPDALLSTAISQDGGAAVASSLAPDSFITQGLTDVSSTIDDAFGGSGVDLSSIGLGVVDPAVLVAAGLGLLVVLWVATRK